MLPVMKRHQLYLLVERTLTPPLTGLEFLYINEDDISEVIDGVLRLVGNYDPSLPLNPYILDRSFSVMEPLAKEIKGDEFSNPRSEELIDVRTAVYRDLETRVTISSSVRSGLIAWSEFLKNVQDYQQHLQRKP